MVEKDLILCIAMTYKVIEFTQKTQILKIADFAIQSVLAETLSNSEPCDRSLMFLQCFLTVTHYKGDQDYC